MEAGRAGRDIREMVRRDPDGFGGGRVRMVEPGFNAARHPGGRPEVAARCR